MTPVVRVITVAYNSGPVLDRFIASLATATTAPVELVVVDNGEDHSATIAAVQLAPAQLQAKWVSAGGNVGYGRAANIGAQNAASPWLVVANPDVVWSPGSLDQLLDAATNAPQAGALGPGIVDGEGQLYPSARALPSLTLGVGHALFSRWWPTNPWTRAYQAAQEQTGAQRTAGWLSGSCLLLRRTAFEEIGGFDPSYFMFFEDVDLGERLARSGWENLYVPRVTVTHIGGTSWRETPAPMITAHHRSARQYLFRRYSRWYQSPVRGLIGVGLRLRETVERRASTH